jgi:hypothetical protein
MFDSRERRPELTLRGPVRPDAAPARDALAGSDDGVHWLLAAHEMLVGTVLRGERSRGAPRYIEQFATASRVLLLIPASRPEYSRSVEFSRAGRELAGLAQFCWREKHHHVGISAATVGHRTACLRAEFEGGVRGWRNDAMIDGRPEFVHRHADSAVRCVTVTSLEWLPHSLKPRALSFAIYYDDDDIALTATLQPLEKMPGREHCVIGQ